MFLAATLKMPLGLHPFKQGTSLPTTTMRGSALPFLLFEL
jgi:hypothetical protein